MVGGIAGVALIAVIAWFVLKRRKRQEQHHTLAPVSDLHSELPVPLGDVRVSAWKPPGMPEVDASHGYTEMPTRDAGSTYPFAGPVEMDPHARPAELDGTPTGTGWR